ncbi:hypothetical protein PV325_009064 [Microctonus aethiopoides]|nr:hypothetical protein PV325_009064 [Microctonus aethiopoides]
MTKLRENRFVTLEMFMNDNESPVSIPNFDFILKFQRKESRNSDVAIYRNETDNNYFIFPRACRLLQTAGHSRGACNVNFLLQEAEPLLKFLKENFSLEMINGRNDPTT